TRTSRMALASEACLGLGDGMNEECCRRSPFSNVDANDLSPRRLTTPARCRHRSKDVASERRKDRIRTVQTLYGARTAIGISLLRTATQNHSCLCATRLARAPVRGAHAV